MAYSNYGAYVYCNGERRDDKEDVLLFEDITVKSWAEYCHGVLGDGVIRVRCYKQYAPEIFEKLDDGTIVKISYNNDIDSDPYSFFNFNISFKHNGYKFSFKSGEPNYARMIEPDGTKWECFYDYEYGSGWMT